MIVPPLLLIHISAAIIGILAGAMAMLFRKGSGWHAAAGNVFFIAMLLMGSTAAYMAVFDKPVMINCLVGLFMCYLVSTSWRAARHREGTAARFDVGALLFVSALIVIAIVYASLAANRPPGVKGGTPPFAYLIFGAIAILCAKADVQLLLRGGVSGTQRIGRHLRRMCGAFLLALFSFVPGQARQLPPSLRANPLIYVPHVVFVGLTLYWMVRISRKRAEGRKLQHDDAIVAKVAA